MIRARLARVLRDLATKIDGREVIDFAFHRLNVQATNRYIGWTERYIVALEKKLGPEEVDTLREVFHRFDTQPFIKAGAWKEAKPF